MAICVRCGQSDRNHELKMPNRRYENGKLVCEGFLAYSKEPSQKTTEIQ